MEKGLISILTPFYNTEKYLDECIQSVRDQSYSHWEMLCINDFSTDESLDIVTKHALEDPRIKVFQNTDKGVISALRLAHSKARGEFISRMDSDDIMKVNKLEVLAQKLQLHGDGHVAIGPVKYFADYEIKAGFSRYEKWLNKLIAGGNNYEDIYRECVIPSPSWLAFKTDLDRCGAFTSSTYPEDYDLVFRMYEQGLKCLPETEVLHLWRDYGERASRTSEHYAENSFIPLKMTYFLKLDHNGKPLLIWGAGDKGKRIAKELIQRQIDFTWACDNPNKIGKDIYGVKMKDVKEISSFEQFQSIITVANPEAQNTIKMELENLGLHNGKDYFFFC